MDNLRNRFKARLHNGDDMLGLWFGLANNIAAEVCAQSGFDWLLIDAEHSPLSEKDILSCLQAVAPYDINPIVRPVSGDKNVLKRLCDIGVQTFLVPMIDNAKEANAVVSAVQYPPAGTRGLGTSMARAARWNMTLDYLSRANDEMCVILQIESKTGLKNLKNIAKVDGVDAVFIGPSDLGAALGYPGQPSHPEVIKAVSQAIRDVCACSKPAGVLAVTSDLVGVYKEAGASFVGVGSDCGVLAKGVQSLYEMFASGKDAKGEY
jgi:4-hydroxy-2-oxoheptanedioate aldolase